MRLVIQNPEYFEPGYELTVHYMIGDADGYKDFSIQFTEPTPKIQRIIEILEKLRGYIPRGYWGFVFEENHYNHAIEDKVLTEDEVQFLNSLYEEDWDDYIIRGDYCDEREFLVYEGYDVTFTDSLGIVHPVDVILEDNEQTQKEQNAETPN